MKLRIGETARRAGLNPMTLKRLEKKGLLTSVRDVNGHRVYDETALDVLARLYHRGDDGHQNATTPGR